MVPFSFAQEQFFATGEGALYWPRRNALLLAGTTLVLKPSPKAPSAAYALCELSSRVDWPAGVLNLLQGDTAAIAGLCAADIDRLVYAGNAALGMQIGVYAEAAGKPFVMRAA